MIEGKGERFLAIAESLKTPVNLCANCTTEVKCERNIRRAVAQLPSPEPVDDVRSWQGFDDVLGDLSAMLPKRCELTDPQLGQELVEKYNQIRYMAIAGVTFLATGV